MNENLLKAKQQTAIYKLKEGTTTSYYYQSGVQTLPERIGFNKFEFDEKKRTRRNLHIAVAQLKATFKKSEISSYKKFNPYTVHTSIWRHPKYKDFYGYGSIGISDEKGGIIDIKDLIIINEDSNNSNILEIHIFQSMLMNLEEVFRFLNIQKLYKEEVKQAGGNYLLIGNREQFVYSFDNFTKQKVATHE